MDKVFPTRMDEAVVQTLDSLAATLRTSGKRIVEDAIRLYSEIVEQRPDSSLGRYRNRRVRAWGDTGVGGFKPGAILASAGPSLGRYGSRRVQAWGDTGVGGFKPGAIREPACLSVGRYRSR